MENKKLIVDYQQYGFRGLLKRIIKRILRIVGLKYNSYYYMVNDIDYSKQKSLFEKSNISVKLLTYDDFLKGNPSEFTEKKVQHIRERLHNGDYEAYGIIENDKLIYSCWISLKWLESSNKCIEGPLQDNECLLFDAYCSPEGRGRGFHSAMNSYRLMKAYEYGKRRTVVIVLSENSPAYRSQLKTGNRVLFKFYVFQLFGKSFSNYHKKKTASQGK